MSITLTGSVSLTNSTLRDGIADPSTNLIYIVEGTTPSFRRIDPVNLIVMNASAVCLTAPSGITMINTASAVIVSSSVTTVDYIEVATGYRTNVAGGLTTFASFKSQQIAGDTSAGIAFATSSTINTLVKMTSGQVITKPVINGTASFTPICVILKSPGRWLVGGKFGKVYEIDSSANIIDQLDVGNLPNTGISSTNANISPPTIGFMSYDNNLLLVSTEDSLQLFDYSTKTKLWHTPVSQSLNTGVLCAAASGITLFSRLVAPSTENNIGTELDFTVAPVQVRDCLFTDSTNLVVATGLNPASNLGFLLQSTSEKVRIFNVIPRGSTTRTITVQVAGIDQKARVLLLNDTGLGTATRLLGTVIQSPGTYRVPTGTNIIEIVKVGDGTNALWDVTRYST